VQVLALCRRAGLVKLGHVALDGTKVKANASKHKAMSYGRMAEAEAKLAAEVKGWFERAAARDAEEDRQHGAERRGDEPPDWMKDKERRLEKIREAKAALEAEAREKAEKEGKDPESAKPEDKSQRNFTDPESKIQKTNDGFIQGYNAQAVAGDGQVILAADVVCGTRDQGRLGPMITAARVELAAAGCDAPELVLADAGYWAAGQIAALEADGIRVLVPPDAHCRPTPNPNRRGGLYDQMRQRLRTDGDAELYRRRMPMIEPIFGQTKANRRADRFQRRGLHAVRSEWRLLAATHNLLKLWRAAAPGAALTA